MIRLILIAPFTILLVATFSNAADTTKIFAKDGHYISYENGIIYDEKTNMEWFAGPDKFITWDEAKAWVESLSVEGGGWRLWSNETEGELGAWYFNFYDGNYTWGLRESEGNPRVFAVRPRKLQ